LRACLAAFRRLSDATRKSHGQGEKERAEQAKQRIEAKRDANAKRIAAQKARMSAGA
jgi:hypothetical protein